MIAAVISPKLVSPSPQVPSSAITCTHVLTEVFAPGIFPWDVENSGYLLIGKALGEVLFQLGLLDSDLGGVFGIFRLTALIFFIFIYLSNIYYQGKFILISCSAL